VSDGQDASARSFLVFRHVLPKPLRIDGVKGGEGHDLSCLISAVPKNDDPVEIPRRLLGGDRCPFETDEGGEPSGFVVVLGSGDFTRPDRARHFRVVDRIFACGYGVSKPRLKCLTRVAGFHQVVDHAAPLALQKLWVRLGDKGGQPQVLGVIRHHQEVERPDQTGSQSMGRQDFLAPGEAVSLFRAERVTEHACVGGITGM